MTQGENVNPCPRKKTKREKSFQSKKGRKQKEKIPNQGKWEKAEKRERILDQKSEEKRRNMQKDLRTRRYLNNTELPPNKTTTKRKETTT